MEEKPKMTSPCNGCEYSTTDMLIGCRGIPSMCVAKQIYLRFVKATESGISVQQLWDEISRYCAKGGVLPSTKSNSITIEDAVRKLTEEGFTGSLTKTLRL